MKIYRLFRTTCSLTLAGVLTCQAASGGTIFINEIHYDNAGADVGEAVEIAGPAGTDLAGWQLLLYNGNSSAVYSSRALGGVIADQMAGHGVLSFDFSGGGLQNGAADGFALVDPFSSVTQFLSYEGSISANSGLAAGMTSLDIGVAETSSTAAGSSLQLAGTGSSYTDFSWTTNPLASFGAINRQQIFTPLPLVSATPRQASAQVPVPASGWLVSLGLLALYASWLQRARRRLGWDKKAVYFF